jgi:signal transduction histidine kinase
VLSHFENRAEKAAFIGFALVLAALVLATIGSAATRVGRPWPGFVVWRNLVVPAIGAPAWPGNRAGIPLRAVVVSVDGVPVHDAQRFREIVRSAPPDRPVVYELRHDRQTIRVEVPTSRLAWRDILPVYVPYWIDGIAFFGVGLIVFYFRPGLPAARATLVAGANLGAVLILASDVFSAFWLDRLYFLCESLTAGGLLHFALCFPEEKLIVRRHPWLKWAVYLPFVPLGLAQNAFLNGDPERHLALNDLVYTAIAAAGLTLVASLAHSFTTSRSPLARQQAKIALAGVGFAAFVPSLGILAIVLLGADVPMNLIAPFFLVYPLSIGYAIARHDLFSVDRYLRLGAVYAAISLVVFLAYAGLVLGSESLLGAGRNLSRALVPAYVLLVVLAFDPLRAAIQRVVDRLFYRQAVSYRATVEGTSRVLASVLDSDRVASTVLGTLTETMAIEWAVLVIRGEEPGELRSFARPPEKRAAVGAALAERPEWLAGVVARTRPLTRYDPMRRPAQHRGSAAPPDAALLERVGATLAFPVRFETEPIGVLVVGEKKSGAFYTDDDLHLIETLVHQSALALTNARAYEIIRRTQAELVEAERLAAVGELASTVAHGIRNPLAGIRAAAQVAREDVPAESPVGESLDDIIAEADRLEARVRSILDLVRAGGAESQIGDLNGFLRQYVAMQRGRLPETVRIELEADPHVPHFGFDAVQFTETLDVVVTNAAEAIGGSGEIRLRTALETNGSGRPCVAIAVSDDGPGMDAARLDRVFDLFYTTKPSGTGVGLAMARRLLERQGGTIEAASEPGRGATFTLRLPIASPQAPEHA